MFPSKTKSPTHVYCENTYQKLKRDEVTINNYQTFVRNQITNNLLNAFNYVRNFFSYNQKETHEESS